ncbi:rRNA-processing endoribonuclease [Ascoidea rubescens DSM 1968]|uniref:18S rRNA biogenesis protein n=1 Tax=Ascoidea rubescens DSM 1968 TaxID=1344418 RepID=A0A1D2VAG9_9ASCO|nr:18S rRNA biogenesis protein [Ascoidea rubescens DSM 1968]ODV58654.1 18S rRNA biogenesis protein [Ascoidea rubescens DSM 1968]
MAKPSNIVFQTHRNFRIRLILSTLSGKPIKIEKIRSNDVNPGLRDYEVSFLRLLESITNGSIIEISYTGTTVNYKPGLIIGGQITHNCPITKPIGYFLEPILYLAPFSKKKFSIVFTGVTSNKQDITIDGIKWGLIPVLEKFGVRECELHTIKRGSPPNGGGEVHLKVNTLLSSPLTLHVTELPKISAVRGIAYCTKVSPSMVNRQIDSARSVLNKIGCEVNITSDAWRGKNSGNSPGFGLTLVAESKKGWRIFVEDIGGPGETPEDVGTRVAYQLFEELSISGAVCRSQLPLAVVFMVLGKEDIGRLIINNNQIDSHLVHLLRDIKKVFGTEVFFLPDDNVIDQNNENNSILTVKGSGFTNASKKIA